MRDSERLDDRQQHGAVARVLDDLLAADLPLLRELFEIRPDDGQQLQDDRRRDVRHDPEGEDRQPAQVPSGEQIEKAEQPSPLRTEEGLQSMEVHSGDRDMPADAVDRQHQEGEDDSLPEIGDAEDVLDRFDHASFGFSAGRAATMTSASLHRLLW